MKARNETENDKAWAKYIDEKGILFDQAAYVVEADELRHITGREPRLLAKFDTPEQLAEPIREKGYTLIPTRNGQYQIVRGNLFVELITCETYVDFQPSLGFPLETAGRGSSESQYIDQAFNTGLLHQFLRLSDLYLTIRGREYTKQFEFMLLGQNFNVESVQIEVDAGYEARHDIVLLEAKIGVPKYFNVRQMYYPYRHFSKLVPRKRIRNVFLAYDTNATYHLYEYTFENQNDPLSASMEQCLVCKIIPAKRLQIDDLLDVHFQTHNDIVPQADDLNKVFELLTVVANGANRAQDVADYFVFDRRQSGYYREAAEYLGLITFSHGEDYTLTPLGILALSQPLDTQTETLAKIVVNSWIFETLIQMSGKQRVFTNADIDTVIESVKTKNGTSRYGGTTVQRRRQTIVTWIKWLAREMGCFAVEGSQYRIQ